MTQGAIQKSDYANRSPGDKVPASLCASYPTFMPWRKEAFECKTNSRSLKSCFTFNNGGIQIATSSSPSSRPDTHIYKYIPRWRSCLWISPEAAGSTSAWAGARRAAPGRRTRGESWGARAARWPPDTTSGPEECSCWARSRSVLVTWWSYFVWDWHSCANYIEITSSSNSFMTFLNIF